MAWQVTVLLVAYAFCGGYALRVAVEVCWPDRFRVPWWKPLLFMGFCVVVSPAIVAAKLFGHWDD